ncbi:MAG TPA: DUF883 C-terminal domain-containing protein [Sinorhizobium sp.]|nr:DUF883 C-terminal domain-containing protein [Sinorhizobium sp.]
MATGLFSSSGTRKHNGGSSDVSIPDQLQEIRADIGKLETLITDRGLAATEDAKAKARGARAQAEADLQDLLVSGEEMLSDLRSRYADTEKEVGRMMREHPIATIGAAAALGLFVAALLRR